MPNDVLRPPVADDELLIERVFAAPPQLLFDMWSQARHFLRWFGPEESRCLEADLEFRVGGEWSACVLMPTMGPRRMGGRYLEIVAGRRIVMTFQWRNEEAFPETVVTLTFDPVDDGRTVQTFHQAPFETVESRDSHFGGWTSVFNREQAYAEAEEKAE